MPDFTKLINDRIESLRPKLQDTSRRNPLINNVLSAKSASFIRIVDEKPQGIYDGLYSDDGSSMRLIALPSTDIDPPDENTIIFRNAFQSAQATDEAYLAAIEKIDFESDDQAYDKLEDADRVLKDRIRELLEMPPRPTRGDQFSDLKDHARSHGIDPSSSLPLPSVDTGDDRHEDDALQTLMLPKPFQSRMSRILSKARMYQEERGLDVVYIVIGYLKWTLPNADKDDEFKSPLLLIPVLLKKRKSTDGEIYEISRIGEPRFNPSLAHKITHEADLDIADVADFAEAGALDVEAFLNRVADLKPRNMRWQVLREASFGVYPFQGIELYYDLDTKSCDFSEFSIVSELMVGRAGSEAIATTPFCEADVESKIGEKLVPHLVLDADSSQFISLLKVANHENVALEGPPGSGKSQTIVNAIANAIYSGSRVLFVAQKVTALEVVYSRLQALGLENFVLPLMGGYGSSDEFYKALQKRLEMRGGDTSREILGLRQELLHQRDTLSRYIELLTRPAPKTGMSVHQVLGLKIAHSADLEALPASLIGIQVDLEKYIPDFSPKDVEGISARIAYWAQRLFDTNLPRDSVWSDVDDNYVDIEGINDVLVSARQPIAALKAAVDTLPTEQQEMFWEYLNNDFSSIRSEVSQAQKSDYLKQIHALVTAHGDKKIGAVLSRLLELKRDMTRLSIDYSVPLEKLPDLPALEQPLKWLHNFATTYKIELLEPGRVARTIASLKTKASRLDELIKQQHDLDAVMGVRSKPSILLAFKGQGGERLRFQRVQDLVRRQNLESIGSELRQSLTCYRASNQLLVHETLPSPPEIMKLRDTIKNSGLLAFLSSDVKNAKRRAVSWLNDLSERDTKEKIIFELDRLLDQSRTYYSLELSEQFGALNDESAAVMREVLETIERIKGLATDSGVDPEVVLNICCLEGLDDRINSVEVAKVGELSWIEISERKSRLDGALTRAEGHVKELENAEKFLSDAHCKTLSELSFLTAAPAKVRSLVKERDEQVALTNGGISSRDDTKALHSAYTLYREMSEISKTLALSETGSALQTVFADQIGSLELVDSCVRKLIAAKGQVLPSIDVISINKAIELLDAHREDRGGLATLVSRRSIAKEAASLGCGMLVESLVRLATPDRAERLARAAIISHLVEEVERDYGAQLLEFDGTSLNEARDRLKRLDRRIIELSPREVANSALQKANPPEGNSYGRKSEYTDLALLQHELGKTRRTPPRKVLKRAQGALLELFPCWMMVPTAVAQNLPRQSVFDLVIIDEASQMTPENSISALMRAKNALIAGDTNQLPPTNFFKGLSTDDEEDEDVATTEESILELANLQFHPKHRLLWHYRSKHEDLIAFSNHYVYDSELVIFPSPNPTTEGLGISMVWVNGTFQRGVNPAEAQVMVEAIAQFMKDTPDRSLGVAVMNQSQMEQIESLILRESENNQAVADYLDYWSQEREGLEKFFVKNLENVQGDERDVIFVGTVYGRDAQGKFYQRFGPINGPAGKRRLNVLFSRAKEQIVTFSSIPLADFNPNPTNEGATLLRRWLEFSSTKKLGEVAHDHKRAGHTDSPFEDHVIEAIESLGYESVPQVGVSSYFIDIGVKHASYPFGYICGVECDGASYHSSKSARDRDRLREEVLSRLGWDLYRIWSTDWFRDALGCREVMKRYLDSRLEELVSNMPEPLAAPRPIFVEQDIPEHSDSYPGNVDDEQVNSTESPESDPIERPDSLVGQPVPQPRATASDTSLTIDIGTKFSLRYLDGPRAGVMTKFWFQHHTNDPAFNLEGYTVLGPDSPLGAVIEEEAPTEGDILEYELASQTVHVQIIEVEQAM